MQSACASAHDARFVAQAMPLYALSHRRAPQPKSQSPHPRSYNAKPTKPAPLSPPCNKPHCAIRRTVRRPVTTASIIFGVAPSIIEIIARTQVSILDLSDRKNSKALYTDKQTCWITLAVNTSRSGSVQLRECGVGVKSWPAWQTANDQQFEIANSCDIIRERWKRITGLKARAGKYRAQRMEGGSMASPRYGTALIVGAGHGLSASLARLFSREGMRVVYRGS